MGGGMPPIAHFVYSVERSSNFEKVGKSIISASSNSLPSIEINCIITADHVSPTRPPQQAASQSRQWDERNEPK
jgi:hypothetical protein